MGGDLLNRRGLLSFDEAAQYLCVSPGTLRNWTSMRRVEFVKIGRLTRFTQTALDRYITSHTVRTAEPHEPV
jgi:excisionase family DNA binding protein